VSVQNGNDERMEQNREGTEDSKKTEKKRNEEKEKPGGIRKTKERKKEKIQENVRGGK
jgi:hypothetical protein